MLLVEPRSSTSVRHDGVGEIEVVGADDLACRVRYRDLVGLERILWVDTGELGGVRIAPGDYRLEWRGQKDADWRTLTVRVRANLLTLVQIADHADAPYVRLPRGFGSVNIVVRTLGGRVAAGATTGFIEGAGVEGLRRVEFDTNLLGERRVALRAGPYRVSAGKWQVPIEIRAGESTAVRIESARHGELFVATPGQLTLARDNGRDLVAIDDVFVMPEQTGRRYLFLDPGRYEVLWGDPEFRLGSVDVPRNRSVTCDFQVPSSKAVIRFLSDRSGKRRIYFEITGGPRGFIGRRQGRWQSDVEVAAPGGVVYAILGLLPGTYVLSLGGDIGPTRLTLDASPDPKPVEVHVK